MKVQWKLPRCCAHILEAREARLKELQGGSDAAPSPTPLSASQSPWARTLEAPTACLRGVADDEVRQEILKEFSGGAKQGQDLLDFFANCRWEAASAGKAKGGTWVELAADFEVVSDAGLKPPLYRRSGQKPLTRIERNKSAEQKAYLMHR